LTFAFSLIYLYTNIVWLDKNEMKWKLNVMIIECNDFDI
jgi:hypothetical protein